jgi:hypothetical protein
MGVGGQLHAPAALPPGMTRYPLYRRLGGPQGRSGRVLKISPPPAFDTRTVQPVASAASNGQKLPAGNSRYVGALLLETVVLVCSCVKLAERHCVSCQCVIAMSRAINVIACLINKYTKYRGLKTAAWNTTQYCRHDVTLAADCKCDTGS